MKLFKVAKDKIVKTFLGDNYAPRGLFELSEYFLHFEKISFEYHKENDLIIAVSTNFEYGSIITSGRNEKELGDNIKDAILTSFGIPSVYADRVKTFFN